MKISYNWLKDYISLSIDPNILASKLSLVGFEVEEVFEKRLDYPQVVIGKILSVRNHPNADKLSLCQVDVGDEKLEIICGAPNVQNGQTVPVAKIGAELPIGLEIKKTKIRGFDSNGMICSEQELGLAEASDGIWILPKELKIGQPLATALNFEEDYIFDLAITPNRPDGLSHLGIAREVGAILGLPVQRPKIHFSEIDENAADKISVEIQCPESCPRYAARVIKSVKIGPSPPWLVRRLESVGMRSINNIVDITNFVLLETGHPLHAFDYNLIKGQKIIVRESLDGEYFMTLDEKGHELREGTVLICDAEKSIALGGIMGGLNSEVGEQTTNILLESAYFLPENIMKSLRYLGISSEASQRFERGADPNDGVIFAQSRATDLMVKLSDGKVFKGVVDEYPKKIHPVNIPFDHSKINLLLGTDIPSEKMAEILEKIDLKVTEGNVIVPTFRPDLHRVADLAEEVARLYGLDNISASTISAIPYNILPNKYDIFTDKVRDVMVGMGVQEVFSSSMINKERLERITGEKVYPILNPISRDMNGMRNSLIVSLLSILQWNKNRQLNDLKVFEINRVYYHPGSLTELPTEELKLAIAMTGNREPELWYSNRQLIDFYDIKGIVEGFLNKISLDNSSFISYDNFVVSDQSLAIKI
jgi:phenylalanyl-tRNA synthetase beta chain